MHVGGNADFAATVESSMEMPQKIKNGSVFLPSDPTSENISKGTQNTNLKEHKQPKCPPTDEWKKTTNLHNGILLSHKKEDFTLCNNMDGPGEHYAK